MIYYYHGKAKYRGQMTISEMFFRLYGREGCILFPDRFPVVPGNPGLEEEVLRLIVFARIEEYNHGWQ